MDLFEEIVRMRKAGQRGALATIVHTNGSIPSYESSRMLVREDGSIAGTIGGGCVEAEVWAAAKEVMQAEAAAQDDLQPEQRSQLRQRPDLRRHAGDFRRADPAAADALHFRRRPRFDGAGAARRSTAGFAIGVIDDRESFANRERFPMAHEIYTSSRKPSRRSSRTPRPIW